VKTQITTAITAFILIMLIACEPQAQASKSAVTAYDSTLAITYGADQFGMKKYIFAFSYRGLNRDRDSLEAAQLQQAHLENIGRLAEAGKLVLAGPFLGSDDLRGIYIFNVDNIAEAEALTNTDPAIKAGSLRMELREWYGSAALMGVNDLHKKVAKKAVTD
jgi:uncharacterized protein YciI